MLKIDIDQGRITDESGMVVDLKNEFAWGIVYGGPVSPLQMRLYAERAYHRAKNIPYNEPTPEFNLIASDLNTLPLIDWYQEWLESPWPLTSSSGRKYVYSERDGLRSA